MLIYSSYATIGASQVALVSKRQLKAKGRYLKTVFSYHMDKITRGAHIGGQVTAVHCTREMSGLSW